VDTTAGDREAVRAYLGGDPNALSPLVRSIFGAVYERCRRRLSDREEAEDVAQETLLRVVRELPSLDEDCPFRRWVNTVALRVCLDRMRRQRIRARVPRLVVAASLDPAERVLDAEDGRLAIVALRTLRARHREAIVRREILGQSHAEMAAAMGSTEPVVKALLYRARGNLRRAYAELVT
jgi:RNA polymerase sigma-70 factor (ECF subfamily)